VTRPSPSDEVVWFDKKTAVGLSCKYVTDGFDFGVAASVRCDRSNLDDRATASKSRK
jgi:hypothetical protein